ncbi:hypothetical protein OsJ_19101 [Oryza sativa Japonica Group]|uniref:UspA domain-containing protein n=1 Tax=Oryza sativa subsp. japonica TaxID=39947 RepID=B9FKZ8_ORYSJ|nr:hypothetical protein OsJ_19101 [Oryza sativa Japonica Group]
MATHPASPVAGGEKATPPSTPPPVRLAGGAAAAIQPNSPRFFFSSLAAASASASSPHRRIAIAVDLSDESAFAVKWSVQNYLRPGDAVVLLHHANAHAATRDEPEEAKKKREEDFDAFTSTKAQDLAQPLVAAQIPFKIHIVKDHDMKERLCLEARAPRPVRHDHGQPRLRRLAQGGQREARERQRLLRAPLRLPRRGRALP